MVSNFALRDVRELFELRRVFEPLGLERLSETWDEEVVGELSRSFEKFPELLAEDLLLDYLHEDRRFHKRKEHREICAAIAAHDLSATTEALFRHLRNVEELITALARERGVDGHTGERSA